MSTPMTIWDFNTVDGFNARYMYTVCVFSYSSDIETGSEPYTSIDVQMKLIRTLADMIEQNNPYYNNKLSDNTSVYGGVGYTVSSFSEFKKSYIQAYQTLHIAKCNILKDKILHYNQISLFRMIDINNQDMLKCVVSDCLGSLPEHPELMTTFLTYLDNDRNMNPMSTVLSIVYRYLLNNK